MPEITGDANVTFYLTDADLTKLATLKVNDGTIFLTNGKWAARNKNGDIEIECTEEVTLEFELSDFAQERDEP